MAAAVALYGIGSSDGEAWLGIGATVSSAVVEGQGKGDAQSRTTGLAGSPAPLTVMTGRHWMGRA